MRKLRTALVVGFAALAFGCSATYTNPANFSPNGGVWLVSITATPNMIVYCNDKGTVKCAEVPIVPAARAGGKSTAAVAPKD